MKKLSFLTFAACSALFFFACNKEDNSCQTTYSKEVKAIIDNSCAYSGCHSGSTASAWVTQNSKDYTNYEGMLINLNNGKFEDRVLTQRNMPPNSPPASNFIPEGRPKTLTAAELDIIQCWMENEYPKDRLIKALKDWCPN